MKADKLRGLDNGELESQAREMKEQLFRLRLQISMGQTDGLKKYRGLRKERARVLTILRERESPAEPSAEAADKE
jgi:large subunit ribosomal protein L29